MAISLKHAFQSAKADGGNATLVQPSNWNAEHTVTAAADRVLGVGGVAGPVAEFPWSALTRSLIACTTAAEIAAVIGTHTTGDVKLTLKTVADAGWVLFNDGTVGSAASGATARANADCEALFKLLWNNISDAYAPVVGGRGASADADWLGNRRITLLKTLGRALGVAGAGSGLTGRALGQNLGAENETLDISKIPPHTHAAAVSDPGHGHGLNEGGQVRARRATGTNVSGGGNVDVTTVDISVQGAFTGIGVTNSSTGGGQAHNNMQPTTFLNAMIKL